MATFSATMTPPSGVTVATVYQAKSGKVYTPSSGTVVVSDEGDARDLICQGWATTSITRG
jgi:hypothetical protein